MKNFNAPEIEVIKFNVENIITTSNDEPLINEAVGVCLPIM